MADLRCGCDICGRGRAAVQVTFSRNVGMLIMRQTEVVEGYHCAACLVRNFAVFMALNLTLGWWGTISFVLTIFYSLSNIVTFAWAGGLLAFAAISQRVETARIDSERARVDADAALGRFRHTIRMRLRNGESVAVIAQDMVEAANVPPQKATAYVEALAADRPLAATD